MTVSQAFPGYDAPARPPCASCGAISSPRWAGGWCDACAAGLREDYAWLRAVVGLSRRLAAERVGVKQRTAERWEERGLVTMPVTVRAERSMREWTPHAACRDRDGELFHPPGEDQRSTARAKAVCGICPVQPECFEWAMDHDEYGIWGGTTRRERAAIRAETETKPCAGCGAEKFLKEYAAAPTKDGRRSRCKACEAAEGSGSPGG